MMVSTRVVTAGSPGSTIISLAMPLQSAVRSPPSASTWSLKKSKFSSRRLGRWGNGDVEVGLSELGELPYVMGLVRQAYEKQMGDGDGNA